MANGSRKPTVHFTEDLPRIAAPIGPKTTITASKAPANGWKENRIIGVRHFDRQISKESSIDEQNVGTGIHSQQNHCSNKLFFAILLSVLVLVIGAIAITLILVLTREKDNMEKQQKIIIFGDDNCVDMANNCAENKALCNNDIYKGMMTIYCRKTCDFCTTFPFVSSSRFCFDKPGYAGRCANWKKNGFCENSFWPESTRREYCAKTCAFC